MSGLDTRVLSWAVDTSPATRESVFCEKHPVFMDLCVEVLRDGSLVYVIRTCRLDGRQFPALVLRSRSRARVRWAEASGGEVLPDEAFRVEGFAGEIGEERKEK